MTNDQILDWIQNFACGFRYGVNGDDYYLDWLDKLGVIHTTKGCNLRDAVIGAKLERDDMYRRVSINCSNIDDYVAKAHWIPNTGVAPNVSSTQNIIVQMEDDSIGYGVSYDNYIWRLNTSYPIKAYAIFDD